ncbi:hypothetical protein DFJ43DRAFT_1135864 [Lentinula guzmanii]|uniref:Secreted protein n=1 Tax=Lentinula guzmanii TaxID=2804957 RepID=A0AA38N5N1_9AGAR|nr:hypothetical protein DFJ43DRAFT_1135864 [Lentinula guzmanii]
MLKSFHIYLLHVLIIVSRYNSRLLQRRSLPVTTSRNFATTFRRNFAPTITESTLDLLFCATSTVATEMQMVPANDMYWTQVDQRLEEL